MLWKSKRPSDFFKKDQKVGDPGHCYDISKHCMFKLEVDRTDDKYLSRKGVGSKFKSTIRFKNNFYKMMVCCAQTVQCGPKSSGFSSFPF